MERLTLNPRQSFKRGSSSKNIGHKLSISVDSSKNGMDMPSPISHKTKTYTGQTMDAFIKYAYNVHCNIGSCISDSAELKENVSNILKALNMGTTCSDSDTTCKLNLKDSLRVKNIALDTSLIMNSSGDFNCAKNTDFIISTTEKDVLNYVCISSNLKQGSVFSFEGKDDDYKISTEQTIETFIKEGCLKKEHDIYYFLDGNNYKILSWNNLKRMKNKNTLKLFWLFRKVIVGCMIQRVIREYQNVVKERAEKIKTASTKEKYEAAIAINLQAVGSNDLTSDYDITVYGHDSFIIVKNFNILFHEYFNKHSSIVFDTNIYGKGWVSYENKKNIDLIEHDCSGNGNFIYIFDLIDNEKNNYVKKIVQNSQIMWAYIQYYKFLIHIFGEKRARAIFDSMMNKLPVNNIILNGKNLLNRATEIYDYLETNDFTYDQVLRGEENFMNNYELELYEKVAYDKYYVIKQADYISFANYYGSETYLTRGTFLDIVINNQTCKTNKLQLTTEDYLMSLLENAGYFIEHNETVKYLVRVYKCLENLIKLNPKLNDKINLKNFEAGLNPPKTILCPYDEEHVMDIDNCNALKIIKDLIKTISTITIILLDGNEYILPYSPEKNPKVVESEKITTKQSISNATSRLKQNISNEIGGGSNMKHVSKKIMYDFLISKGIKCGKDKNNIVECFYKRKNLLLLKKEILQKILKKNKLDTLGKKEELIKRIRKLVSKS